MDVGVRAVRTQIAPEATVASGGSDFFRFRGLMSTLNTTIDGEEIQGDGKFNEGWMPGEEGAAGELSGPGAFALMTVPFDGVYCRPVVVNGAGSSVSRTYEPNPYGADTVRTYALEKGNDTGRFNKRFHGVAVNGLTLNATKRTFNWTAPVFAQPHTMRDALTAGATKAENVQIVPKEVDHFISLVSFADLDVAPVQLLRAFEYNCEIADRWAMVSPMNSALDSWAAFVENGDPVGATVTLRLGLASMTYGNTAVWAATQAYTKGTVRRKTGAEQANKLLFRVVTAGTSGASEPAGFTTATEGQQFTDGTVVWEAVPYDFTAPFGLYDIRKGTLIYHRLKTTGPVITTGINYTLQHDTCIVLTAVPEEEAEGGLVAGTYTGLIVPDPTTDKAIIAKTVTKFPDWP